MPASVVWLPKEVACLVSMRDQALVTAHRWWLCSDDEGRGRRYAYTYYYSERMPDGKRRRTKVYMHRLITGCPAGWMVDHRNRDGLDNQRHNLRITQGCYNSANREVPISASGYRGVQQTGLCSWRARIEHLGDAHHLGCFSSAEDAARAYDRKATEIFGEFAWLNFDDRAPFVEEALPF